MAIGQTFGQSFGGLEEIKRQTPKSTSMFPGFNEKQIEQLKKDTANLPADQQIKAQTNIYREVLPKIQAKKIQEQRETMKNELYNQSLNEKDPTKQKMNMAQIRLEDLADEIKNKYNLNPNAPTDGIIESFNKMLNDKQIDPKLVADYMNNGSEEIFYAAGLRERPVEEEKGFFGKVIEGASGMLEESSRIAEGGIALLDKVLGNEDFRAMEAYSEETYGMAPYKLKQENPALYEEFKANIEENPEILEQYKTSVSEDILDIGQGALTTAGLAVAPMIMGGMTIVGSTKPGQAVLEPVMNVFGTLGSAVNYIPGLSDFKDSLPEDKQEEFDMFVGSTLGAMLLGTKGKKNIIKDPKKFIAENVGSKQIIDNFKENVIGIKDAGVTAKNYVAKKLDPGMNLDDALIKEAQTNPYTAEYLNDIHKTTDGNMKTVTKDYKDFAVKKVGDEYIKPELDKIKENYAEGGSLYKNIRETNQIVDIDGLDIDTKAIVDKYSPKISVKNETLINNAIKEVDKAMETAKGGKFDVETALAVRKNLSDMADYTERGTIANTAVKEIRASLDKRIKDQVAGLAEVDKIASQKIKQIENFEKQLINKEGNINYNNLKNVNSLAKTDLAKRLDEFVPGATDRIDAIDKAIRISKKTKGVGTIGKLSSRLIAGGLGAAATGGPLGAVLGLILDEAIIGKLDNAMIERNQGKLLKVFDDMSPEAKSKLENIGKKIEENKKLTANDTKAIQEAKDIFTSKQQNGDLFTNTNDSTSNVTNGQTKTINESMGKKKPTLKAPEILYRGENINNNGKGIGGSFMGEGKYYTDSKLTAESYSKTIKNKLGDNAKITEFKPPKDIKFMEVEPLDIDKLVNTKSSSKGLTDSKKGAILKEIAIENGYDGIKFNKAKDYSEYVIY